MRHHQLTPPSHPAFWAFILLMPLLSACGFTPLYGELENGSTLQDRLAKIAIVDITEPATTGYMFQRELKKRFGEERAAEFDLKVNLKESRVSVAVTGEANTNRFSYTLRASYKLVHRETEKTFTGSLSATNGYGIVPSQYSSLVGEEQARRKSIEDLAGQLEMELILALRGFDE